MNIINKISIITLTYKNLHLLSNAISSVNSQVIDSKYGVEYLVVDDCSPNFNREYVESKLESCSFQCRLIINPKNLGTVKSFNQAILGSTGDVIIPLSADDEFYDENVVGNIIDEFETSQELIITGIRVPVKDNTELNPLPLIKDRHFFQSRTSLLNRIASRKNIISGASTYYHRKVFDEIDFFDESYRLLEDYPFYLKALASDVNIHFLDRKVIRYGTEGITSSGQINPVLKDDVRKSYRYAISLGILDYSQMRFVFYSKILNRNEQIKFSNLLKYPEQFLYLCFLKVIYIMKR